MHVSPPAWMAASAGWIDASPVTRTPLSWSHTEPVVTPASASGLPGSRSTISSPRTEHAKKRGAKIYGEVVGYGMSGDGYHVTAPAPDGNGGYRAMEAAFKRAGMTPGDVDYVNAHGTSTPLGDEIEFGAVKRLFGNAAAKISMSSTKSAIGHLLGAAGAVETIFSVLAMRDNIAPPTLNLEDLDDKCTGIDLVPLKAREREINVILSNSFGFGGTNASLIVKAFDA